MVLIYFDRSIKIASQQAITIKQENIAFMKMSLNLNNINLLPSFDIILCLSVYQHFCRAFGEKHARELVEEIFAKCNKQLFFQIPSKKNKFGAENFLLISKTTKSRLKNMLKNCLMRLVIVGKTNWGKNRKTSHRALAIFVSY